MLATLRANVAATLLGLLAAILLVITVVMTVQVHGFLWIDGLKDKVANLQRDNNELRAELKSISDKRNEQANRTSDNIAKADEGNRRADDVARRIEEAPVAPGKCETPDAVRNADI